eukprot:scaffold2114_cov253-Pinguiococcus_pyrenoidosus.AAC.2
MTGVEHGRRRASAALLSAIRPHHSVVPKRTASPELRRTQGHGACALLTGRVGSRDAFLLVVRLHVLPCPGRGPGFALRPELSLPGLLLAVVVLNPRGHDDVDLPIPSIGGVLRARHEDVGTQRRRPESMLLQGFGSEVGAYVGARRRCERGRRRFCLEGVRGLSRSARLKAGVPMKRGEGGDLVHARVSAALLVIQPSRWNTSFPARRRGGDVRREVQLPGSLQAGSCATGRGCTKRGRGADGRQTLISACGGRRTVVARAGALPSDDAAEGRRRLLGRVLHGAQPAQQDGAWRHVHDVRLLKQLPTSIPNELGPKHAIQDRVRSAAIYASAVHVQFLIGRREAHSAFPSPRAGIEGKLLPDCGQERAATVGLRRRLSAAAVLVHVDPSDEGANAIKLRTATGAD